MDEKPHDEARRRLRVTVPDGIRLSKVPQPNAIQITVGTEKLGDFSVLIGLLADLDVEIIEIKAIRVDKQ